MPISMFMFFYKMLILISVSSMPIAIGHVLVNDDSYANANLSVNNFYTFAVANVVAVPDADVLLADVSII